MLIDGLITLMTEDTGVSALVSTRIYKSVLPRGYVLPAICIHRYGGSQDYQFSGPADVSEDQVQLDAYGETAEDAQSVVAALKTLLVPYVGALPDGTKVQACYLERDMDMPFLPHADSKSLAYRSVLGFRLVSER